VVGAFLNGIVLVVVVVLIAAAAVARLSEPPHVAGTGVLVLGLLGLAGNVIATLVLAAGEREDINLEGVLRHSAGDALSSLGVVVAGIVVLTTGWNAVDPLMSLLIAAFIAVTSWRLLKEPLDVFMEAAPPGTDVQAVGSAICALPEVVEVHDLHVWTVTSGFPALSAHVVVSPGADRDLARAKIERLLDERFGLDHTTLQMVESTDEGRLIQVETPPGASGP
jgi:cobalt-zinc-cadmium efflux system protein